MRLTQHVADEIRRYCGAHPHACDTLEGITWWVALSRYEETRSVIQDAVGFLEHRGELRRHELFDGSVVFGCGNGCGS